jgi:hypothetical protein
VREFYSAIDLALISTRTCEFELSNLFVRGDIDPAVRFALDLRRV